MHTIFSMVMLIESLKEVITNVAHLNISIVINNGYFVVEVNALMCLWQEQFFLNTSYWLLLIMLTPTFVDTLIMLTPTFVDT